MRKNIRSFIPTKLNQKITLFVICVLAVPVIAFSIIIFEFLRNDRIDSKMKNVKNDMVKSQHTIQKNVEMCNMCTQVFLNATGLRNFAVAMKQGRKLTTNEVLAFYKSDVASLEKITNSNPYLYQIRMYIDAPHAVEMMPILYSSKRMARLAWGKENDFESGTWQYDYSDTLFAQEMEEATPHIVSLVTRVNDFEYGEIGVLEVATKMEFLFPDLYTCGDGSWSCFVDDKGKYHYDAPNAQSISSSNKWKRAAGHLIEQMNNKGEDNLYQTMELDGKHVIAACEYVKVLNGYFIKITSLEDDIASINRIRNIFVFSLVFGFAATILVISHVVQALLRRLYQTIDAVNLMGKGNLEVRVPVTCDDEIGHLGSQINLMIEHMTMLMMQGIQKERLIKDTEIKALQNQINAHFIYNVLESIKMMAEIKENYDISDALTSLGKLLRYTMKWGEEFVTVSKEVEYIKDYLALINLRFDYRIILSINMPENILVQRIPKMSLQPIVENAIYHGIEELAEDTTIYIKAFIHDTDCTIEIMDSGVGMSETEVLKLQEKLEGTLETSDQGEFKGKSGNGLGLKNVQDRIRMCFGKDYGIDITARQGCYTKVIVKIPYVTPKGGDI